MSPTTTPALTTTAPETRQMAKALHFAPAMVPYIDWNAIARDAYALGADFETFVSPEGIIVSMFYRYTAEELAAEGLTAPSGESIAREILDDPEFRERMRRLVRGES